MILFQPLLVLRPRRAIVPTVLCFLCGALILSSAQSAFGYLLISLRFADGTTTKDVSALSSGDTVTIQVWAGVVGTNNVFTDDGLAFSRFGLLSSGSTGVLSGNLTGGSILAPFDAPAPASFLGTFADRNADGVADWRGTTTNSGSGWPSVAGTPFPSMITGGGATGQQAGPTTWEFHIADATFEVSSVTPGAGGDVLTFDPVFPELGAAFNSGRATWREDGVNRSSNFFGHVVLGPGGTFTSPDSPDSVLVTSLVLSLPEPSSVALLGLGAADLFATIRRRR